MEDCKTSVSGIRQASKMASAAMDTWSCPFPAEVLLLASWSQLFTSFTRDESTRFIFARRTPPDRTLVYVEVPGGDSLSVENWLLAITGALGDSPVWEPAEILTGQPGLDRIDSVSNIILLANSAEAEALAHKLPAALLVSLSSEEKAEFTITYNVGQFSPQFIEVVLACLSHLFLQMLSDLGLPVTKLNLLPAGIPLAHLQGNASEAECSAISFVHDLVEKQCRKAPDAIAVTFQDQQMTYRQLSERADQIACHLISVGIRPDSVVAVHLARSLDLLPAIFGVLKAGAAFLPLDAHLPPARIGAIVQDSQASVVVTSNSLADRFDRLSTKLVVLDCLESLPDQVTIAQQSAVLKPEHLAYVIYTSGSTGTPKGVMIEHRNLSGLLEAHDEVTGTSQGVWLALSSISFDISIIELLWSLSRGFRVVVHEGDEGAPMISGPDSVAAQIVQHGVTHLLTTPTLTRMLVSTPEGLAALAKLQVLIIGGEALPPSLASLLIESLTGKIFNAYGPTETTVCATYHLIECAGAVVPIGKPLANTSLYIVDRWNRILPPLAAGELLIGGTGVGRGYLGKWQLTAERFVANPFAGNGQRLYRTGDLVRMDLNGNLEFVDRLDYQVKIRGYRIELGEIESAMQVHPQIEQALVIARPGTNREKVLVGYYTSSDGKRIPPDELRAYLQEKLPRYMTPSILRCLASFPLNSNGKVDRQLLTRAEDSVRQLAHVPCKRKQIQSPSAANSETTQMEAVLCSWCGELLKVTNVEATDDFFDLGGESLTAVQLTNKITEKYGAQIRLSALVKARTMRQVAALVRQSNAKPSWAPVTPIKTGGSKPPLFLVAGIGGNIINFEFVARTLKNRPIYGVETYGLDRNSNVLTSVEEMARVYLQEIRCVQPHGPYHLAGYSFGGVLAFEIAQQLRAAGERVGLLGLIDTLEWRYMRSEVAKLSLLQRMDVLYGGTLRALVQGPNRFAILRQRLKATFEHHKLTLLRATGRKAQALDATVEHRNYYALTQYVAEPYAGEVYLFRGQEKSRPRGNDPFLGWGGLAKRISVEQIPGGHEQLMSRPYAGVLGARLDAMLKTIESDTRGNREAKTGAA